MVAPSLEMVTWPCRTGGWGTQLTISPASSTVRQDAAPTPPLIEHDRATTTHCKIKFKYAAGLLHLVIMDQLVHPAGAQGRCHCVNNCHAGIDVADELGLALAGVCALLQQDHL